MLAADPTAMDLTAVSAFKKAASSSSSASAAAAVDNAVEVAADGAADADVVTESMVAEEKKLNESSKREKEKEMRQMARTDFDEHIEKQRYQRLKFLLDKTSLYSTFLTEKLNKERAEKREKAERLDKEAASTDDADAKRTKRKMDSDYKISDVITEVTEQTSKKAKVSNGDSISQANDAELQLKVDLPSARQPSLVTGGVLREYQLAGVEWLISLYENGLNGILADEMGLGKTVQCISFLAHLRSKGVWGPFLITAPLSTISNWVSEVKRFTPTIPVVLYHGSIEERARLRAKRMKALDPTFPIVVTSYEIIMNDRKHLQKYRWKYIVVDEGHRIKNLNCKLIRELKSYNSANRLLLTGTPLHNNLSELWSLLNFLLPDIFDDLESFQSWFDFSDLDAESGKTRILGEEAKDQVVSKLHQILSPFLLRRLKVDAEKYLPKKREYLLYAPLSKEQSVWYHAVINRKLRELLKERAMKDELSDEEVEEFAADEQTYTPSETATPAKEASPESLEGESVTPINPAADVVGGEQAGVSSTFAPKLDGVAHRTRSLSRKNSQAGGSSDSLFKPESYVEKATDKKINNMHLQNRIMQLRKVCNHPYLFDHPVDESNAFVADQRLIDASGKTRLLDVLLHSLLPRGHRVLIFSQMTKMLDILGDYLGFRQIPYCRLDGTVDYTDRTEQIREFNSPDSKIPVFLLSTRAGGLGINLTSADTVIIYDSDWNPQMDLQAQDRVHRIGQTNPVIIYRLVTANSVDSRIIERANAKRKLEKLVIHKGHFKGIGHRANEGMDKESRLRFLAEILEAEEREKIGSEQDVVADGPVISSEELERILDRSESAYAAAATGTHAEGSAFKLIEEVRANEPDLSGSKM